MGGFIPSLAQQRGKASYYSNSIHGRRMSDGTRYHRDSLVCAHRTYPLGTLLLVRNPRNGKKVVLKVTDRGPFSHSRVIDVSYAAARELGFISQGTAMVEVSLYRGGVLPPYAADNKIVLPEIDIAEVGMGYEYMPKWGRETDKSKQPRRLAPTSTQQKKETHVWTEFFGKLKRGLNNIVGK